MDKSKRIYGTKHKIQIYGDLLIVSKNKKKWEFPLSQISEFDYLKKQGKPAGVSRHLSSIIFDSIMNSLSKVWEFFLSDAGPTEDADVINTNKIQFKYHYKPEDYEWKVFETTLTSEEEPDLRTKVRSFNSTFSRDS